MRARLMKLGLMISALAAMAIGGSAIATAAQKGGTPTPPIVSPAPAVPDVSQAADGDNVQQGDQSAPDTAGASESDGAAEAAGESASESGPSDGPGGHADPAGAVDTQQEGEH